MKAHQLQLFEARGIFLRVAISVSGDPRSEPTTACETNMSTASCRVLRKQKVWEKYSHVIVVYLPKFQAMPFFVLKNFSFGLKCIVPAVILMNMCD